MKVQQSMSVRRKSRLPLFMVIMARLSLLAVSSHAAIFWDDEMEPGNTGYGVVMPTTGGFDNTVKFSGTASLREDFNGTTQGGYEDRAFAATDDLWGRFYIRLSPGFVVANQTKIMRNDTNTGLMHWWGMLFGGRAVTVQLQNYPVTGDTANFYPNVGDGMLGDGQWNCIETHIKNNTVGQADGVVEAYKDGVQFMNYAGLEIRKSSQGTQNAQFVSNRMYRQAGTGSIWYDRVAFGNTRIGCLGSIPPPSPPADIQVPSVPAGLSAQAASSSQINLTWNASSDNVGVTGYRIFRGGAQIATTVGTSYSDTGLAASTAYSYTVAAYDAAGNASGQSSAAGVTTLAATPPVGAVGTVSNLSVASVGANSATLSFTEADDGTGQPVKYDIRFSSISALWGGAPSVTQGTCATPLAGTSVGATKTCTVLGLSPSTAYQFQLVPFRGTMNVDAAFGALSNVAGARTSGAADEMPPAKPRNMRIH